MSNIKVEDYYFVWLNNKQAVWIISEADIVFQLRSFLAFLLEKTSSIFKYMADWMSSASGKVKPWRW